MYNFPANISTFPPSFNFLIASKGEKRKHEEADFEKRVEISRKTTSANIFLHTPFISRGEKRGVSIGHVSSLHGENIRVKYIDRPLNKVSKMSRAFTKRRTKPKVSGKTYEIRRLPAINRHPPTFPLNKSARSRATEYQNSNFEKLFPSHSSSPPS